MKSVNSDSWFVFYAGVLIISGLATVEVAGEQLLSQPHPYVLEAPDHIDRWEPSAAVVGGQ